MDLDRLKQLAAQGESATLEFKRSTANLKAAGQSLCAFLNTRGGTVFVGVGNNGKLLGQPVTDKNKLEISNILKKFEPSANIDVAYIDIKPDLMVIVMTASPDKKSLPYTFEGRAYERLQADTQVMPRSRYRQLLTQEIIISTSWEEQPARWYLLGATKNHPCFSSLESNHHACFLSPWLYRKNGYWYAENSQYLCESGDERAGVF